MESELSSTSDDSQSNISSRSASPDNVDREQSGSGSPSASSHNSAPQSPDNNTSGSQSLDNCVQSPEHDDPQSPQSPDSSSSKSKSLVDESFSPEHQNNDSCSPVHQNDGSCSPEQQNNEPHSPDLQNDESPSPQHQNDEPESPSSASSSSSRASSTAGSPDRNSHSRASSKYSSRSNESDKEIKEPHNNYLSDVSDEDSMDNINDDNISQTGSQKSAKEWKSDNDTNSPSKDIVLAINGHNNIDAKVEPNVVNDPEEPLDFEAEDGEDGECDEPKTVKELIEIEEKEPEELEEGEVSDEGEHRPEETEPRPICRFYSRGQCTWGASCRFLHPGVTDKGNYSMFEMVRPIPPPGGIPFYPPDPYRAHERPLIPGVPIAPIKKEDVPPVETAWERGLRQAKEILKKSNKKKETDIDFEEKKMNLTSNQEEVEKENDYYAQQRPTSPIVSPAISPPIERFKPELEARHHRAPLPDAYVDEFIPPPVDFYHHRPEFWPPHHGRPLPHFPPGHPMDFHTAPRRNPYYPYPPPDPYYHPSLKPHHRGLPPKYPPNREVIVQRSEKSYSPQPSGHRHRRDRSSSRPRRGDDWSDPWMRSKSPGGGRSKLRGRKKSYSSHSSISSSRSSSSSSASSYNSSSRSRGRSISMTKNRKKAQPPSSFKMSPGRKPNRKPERNPSPDAFEKKSVGRSMNPPVPTNRWSVSPTNTAPSIPPLQRARQMPMPPRFAVNKTSGAKSPSTTHTSSSSSSSEESNSGSSESSESSGSESSSEEGGSPKHRKRLSSPEKLLKKGAISKIHKSQTKQNIKKKMPAPIVVPPVKKEKSATQGKKRSLESDNDDTKISSPPRKKGGTVPSRREELLKQLKAVEDAIARKKSKVAL